MAIESIPVTPDKLVAEVTRLKNEGWRLVTFSSVEIDAENMEVLYHFDKDLALTNLRVQVKKGGHLPSVSGVLFAAFLIENEIRDQFGLTFDGLVIDYQGRLLNDCTATSSSSPFCRLLVRGGMTVKEVK
jgi:ech hydrogenase subunit D